MTKIIFTKWEILAELEKGISKGIFKNLKVCNLKIKEVITVKLVWTVKNIR